MERLKRLVNYKYFGVLTAFGLPLLVSILICIANGVYPFGNQCLLHVDMYHQYCPFFTEFMRKLKTGGNLMYSWHIGLGSDFISVFVYYLASPLNWLIFLWPQKHVIEFMSLLMIGKISFSSAAFYWYVQEHFGIRNLKEKRRTERMAWALICAMAYAFSGFVCAYSWNIMWMDSVAITPIILLGLERLVREKKVTLYYITLAFSIWSNYYISIMICIYLVLYFGYLILQVQDWKEKIHTFMRFAWYSILAGGTAAVLILPEYKILSYSGSSGMTFPQQVKWYFHLLGEIGRGFVTVSNYTGAEHWPNLYAGAFSYLLVALYLFNRKIDWKKKLSAVCIIGFFYISFANNYLDFIWHGLHFPDSLPGRQSFLFIFTILVIGYEQMCNWRGTRIWHIGVAAGVALIFCVTGYLFADKKNVDIMSLVITCLFLVGYALLGVLIRMIRGENQILLKQMVFMMAFAEIVVHASVTGFYTTSRDSYVEKMEAYPKILQMAEEDANGEKFYRLEDTERLTKNDDALYGYSSTTQFSSLMNINVSHFFQSVYMEGGKNFYCYNGATPIPSAMMSVKYFVSEEMLPKNPVRSLVGTVDDLYLYRNEYCLPLGYVVEDKTLNRMNFITGARLSGINRLGKDLGAKEDTLLPSECKLDVQNGKTNIVVGEDGYFYAENSGCTSDTLTIEDRYGKKTEYSKTTHRYLFEIGFYKKGDVITVTNRTQEKIPFQVYRLNMDSVKEAYKTLNQRTMELSDFTDTLVRGKLEKGKAGKLILSVPNEIGWKVYVDGVQQEIESFGDTFISIAVDEQSHEIELVYETPGLRTGMGISIVCVVLFLITITVRRYIWIKKN